MGKLKDWLRRSRLIVALRDQVRAWFDPDSIIILILAVIGVRLLNVTGEFANGLWPRLQAYALLAIYLFVALSIVVLATRAIFSTLVLRELVARATQSPTGAAIVVLGRFIMMATMLWCLVWWWGGR
jgi:hypothetical protein